MNVIYRKQRGVALMVGLILLVVVTLLSVAAMRNANLNTRVAINHQHKQFAFQAAESALAKLIGLKSAAMSALKVPGTVDDDPVSNTDWYVSKGDKPRSSADLSMKLLEISAPGQYKFSGYGLNVVTVVYQADAIGNVDGTGATAHNRMQVALIRD